MKKLCKACNNLTYQTNVYKDRETSQIMAVCMDCNTTYSIESFEPTTEQNFNNSIDEVQEQIFIKSLLEKCEYRYKPESDDIDIILAFRMTLEEGYEPTDHKEFYANYNAIISNSVHEFSTNDLNQLLEDPEHYYYVCGVDDDLDWNDIDMDLRFFYLINNTFYYFVG